jgi:outer membrane biosynthesis protein TonB
MKARGTIDTDRLKGKELAVTISEDTWKGDYRARVNKLGPIDSLNEDEEDEDDEGEDEDEDTDDEDEEDEEDSDEEDEEEDEDEDEDEDEEEEPPAKPKSKPKPKPAAESPAKKAKPKPKPDDEDEEDYSEFTLEELQEEAESRGLRKDGSAARLIRRLEKDDAQAKPF